MPRDAVTPAPTSPASALSYRADLDGVRAVAVLLVLFYHVRFAWCTGGYVGVDVFFVLTGFLITSLLMAALGRGQLGFTEFYLRRIRRILPALVTVLTASWIAGFVLLMPRDLLTFLDSARYALLSAGNFYFWSETGGYFSSDIHDMPLLHTWSLGVEEQFYLVWPALLWLAWRALSQRGLVYMLALLTVGSLGLSQWLTTHHSQAAYFLLPGRAFEILLGALVAFIYPQVAIQNRVLRSALSLLGLLLIVASSLLLNEDSPFPGVLAAVPCLGAAAVILSGRSGDRLGVVDRMLATPPMVFIGRISYSVYLWHWPIIAFLSYRGVALGGPLAWSVVAGSLVLGWMSFKWVEQPLRHRYTFGFGVTALSFAVAPAVFGLLLYSVTLQNGGFPQRFARRLLQDDDPTQATAECPYNINLGKMPKCYVGEHRAQIDGLLVGDSYAGMYVGFMDVLAKDAGLSMRHLWYGLAPPIPGTSVGPKPGPYGVKYADLREALLEKYKIATVISAWGNYNYQPTSKTRLWDSAGHDVSAQADDRMFAVIRKLYEQHKIVILVDRPRAPPGQVLMKAIRAAYAAKKPLDGFRVPITARGPGYILDRVAKQLPNVLIIRPWEAICDASSCAVDVDGMLIYQPDGSHLTSSGSRALGKKYLTMRRNPLRGMTH